MSIPYDEYSILALIAALGKGNPGRDAETRALFQRILQRPNESGLSAEMLEKMRQELPEPR